MIFKKETNMKPEQALENLHGFIAMAQALPAHVGLANGNQWLLVVNSFMSLQKFVEEIRSKEAEKK